MSMMEIERSRTVAFSGHRSFKISGETQTALALRLRESLAALVAEGYDTCLCGMAEGFDLLAGAEVLRLRAGRPYIRLVAVMPYPGQAGRFPLAAAAAHREILHGADAVETVCTAYAADCFHRRNDRMLDRASVLVCYYNGAGGGTRYCYEKALRNGMRVENLCGLPVTGSLF